MVIFTKRSLSIFRSNLCNQNLLKEFSISTFAIVDNEAELLEDMGISGDVAKVRGQSPTIKSIFA